MSKNLVSIKESLKTKIIYYYKCIANNKIVSLINKHINNIPIT